MKHKIPPIHYHDYLKLDDVLTEHPLRSEQFGEKAHDENLFITVHLAYEIWFKQIIIELDSILTLFSQDPLKEKQMGLIQARLRRINEILELVIQQIPILETMTPLDFLDFRDFLYPASGFQSFQFRLIENKLGLKSKQRITYNGQAYVNSLPPKQRELVNLSEQNPNLLQRVDQWLGRTPFLKTNEFDFWALYEKAVQQMFEEEKWMIEKNESLGEVEKKRNYDIIKNSLEIFARLFDESHFQQSGDWNLSFASIKAALFIQLYRDQPVFQSPFRLITELIDLDENLSQWRYRHALMVRRMLGTKIGTGGSSGSEYLKKTSEEHRVFQDFTQLTTFLIPKSKLPELPASLEGRLGFIYERD
ncbi:MAG: tryptophan 2,3-dioxygenase [Bdellovibrionales bacterium]|nr:tryptophan 2,3-dioxygenase [Bdellovibrionales bacterium]